jgi:hypothetical protein
MVGNAQRRSASPSPVGLRKRLQQMGRPLAAAMVEAELLLLQNGALFPK